MLTDQQNDAKNEIVKWFNDDNGSNIFVLAGYAGTGKTYLINHIVQNTLNLTSEEYVFITPTGKAATVLIQKKLENVMTIHRLIYNPVEKKTSEVLEDGKVVKSKKLEFIKKQNIDRYKLIILDEVSMVDDNTMKDLKSYGIKILCSGDIGQLPPIQNTNTILKNPNFILTEVVRQALDNPIIKLATATRFGNDIPYGNYGDVIVVNKHNISDEKLTELMLKSDQVICGMNRTRKNLNDMMRVAKGIDIIKNPLPLQGEKVICQTNNWEKYIDLNSTFNLVNGTIGITGEDSVELMDGLAKMTFKADYLKEDYYKELLFDSGIFKDDEYKFETFTSAYKFADDSYSIKTNRNRKMDGESKKDYVKRIRREIMKTIHSIDEDIINRFEFGYAISCHKSQGSEFDKVVIIDESYIFGEDKYKWLYTAITRAKKKLIIIK